MTHADEKPTDIMAGRPMFDLVGATAELVVIDGPDRESGHCDLARGRARIGTAKNCDLKLSDPTVSRMHCELQATREGVRIVDSDSTNGTFVNGLRVFDAILESGATIRVGNTSIRVELGHEPIHLQISAHDTFGGLIGGSAEMRRVYTLLERIAPTDATVILQGETGTGKELAARAIHDASPRGQGPFVAVDCGAIAENLIESELFGHVRGAFTGAISDRRGLFEEANGGTLFLDEIGELPPALQPKLLRVLETRQVRPVGSSVGRNVDVRVLAATHRRLDRRVNDGTFREDLYYRLAVVEVTLPPLRARREDIPALAEHFIERFAGPGTKVPEHLLQTLLTHSWPGNVREFRNFIERSVSLGALDGTVHQPSNVSLPSILPPNFDAIASINLPLKEARVAWAQKFESVYLQALLRSTGGNVTRAAKIAGVNRRWLQRLIASAGLRAPADRDDDE